MDPLISVPLIIVGLLLIAGYTIIKLSKKVINSSNPIVSILWCVLGFFILKGLFMIFALSTVIILPTPGV